MKIQYGKQSINKEDIKAVENALKSPFLTQGPKVLEFEKSLAKYCGSKYVVACSSGTSALHLAYLAAGLKKGDEVITTSNTFAATSNMLLAVGAKPVFCDIRLDTFNIDESKIERLITKKTKAIVPVDFAGHPAEIEKIKKIAKKHKLLVIEDAAPALGAIHHRKKTGSQSDITIFSFHAVKTITTGEGGAVLTNNRNFYERALLLRSHGIVKDKQGFNVMSDLGYNYRLTELQGALGLSQLKRVEQFIKKRHQVVEWYEKYFKGQNNIFIPKTLTNNRSAWHIYVIRVKNQKDRIPLYNFLKENGIGVNFHYVPVHSHPYYKKLGFSKIKLPNTEEYAETAITLPLHVELKEKDIKFIVGNIKRYFIQ